MTENSSEKDINGGETPDTSLGLSLTDDDNKLLEALKELKGGSDNFIVDFMALLGKKREELYAGFDKVDRLMERIDQASAEQLDELEQEIAQLPESLQSHRESLEKMLELKSERIRLEKEADEIQFNFEDKMRRLEKEERVVKAIEEELEEAESVSELVAPADLQEVAKKLGIGEMGAHSIDYLTKRIQSTALILILNLLLDASKERNSDLIPDEELIKSYLDKKLLSPDGYEAIMKSIKGKKEILS